MTIDSYGADPVPRLLIAWHSRTGGAWAMARAAAEGAGAEGAAAEGAGAAVMLHAVAEVRAEDFVAAGAYLFAGPENLGAVSGLMKEMFDRCHYPLLGRIEGCAYATITAAGSDGEGRCGSWIASPPAGGPGAPPNR